MGLRGIWEGFIFKLKYYYDKVYITVNVHKLGQGISEYKQQSFLSTWDALYMFRSNNDYNQKVGF